MLADILMALFVIAVVASLFLERVGDPFSDDENDAWDREQIARHQRALKVYRDARSIREGRHD